MMDAAQLIEKKEHLVYEDEKTVAVMSPTPMAPGHMIVLSKEKYQSMDEVPVELVSHFYYVASFAASAIFEAIGPSQQTGTNIICNDGFGGQEQFDHFAIHVIPRKEGDGISYKWEPKQGDQAKLDENLKKLKEETFFIGKDVAPKEEKTVDLDKRETKEAETGEENYLVKHLDRMP